ncbi:heterokaryon incompatibility 6 OR allele [Fusarium coicis]|nr:heterokaryon incompatibility 6 OR allele [Fusarium coicis]
MVLLKAHHISIAQGTDELRGTLRTHPIHAAPKYEALGYVWGPPKRTKSIQCNGQDFNITEGLYTVLRRLRLPGKPRHIWIDQICINQESVTERSEQVSIMRHIYSNAEIVNAWLGPADPDVTASAAGIIKALANPKPRLYEKDLFPEDLERRPLWAPRWHSDEDSHKHYLLNYRFTASRDVPMVLGPSRNEKGNRHTHSYSAVLDMIARNVEVFNKRYGSDIIRTVLLTMMAGHESSGPHVSQDGREPEQRRYLELVRFAAKAIYLPAEPCWTSPEDFEFRERILKTLYPHDPSVVAADLDMLSRIHFDFFMGPQRFAELIQASHDSKIFLTDTGYVGFGPRCLRLGDVVCVVFGVGTPYVIRPTSVPDEYLFLGPAYVHGLMDGEAIDAWEKGKRTENQEIEEKLFKLL